MSETDGKIPLPKKTQEEMLKFFLRTSIPRKKRLLSENKSTDRSVKNGNENRDLR